MRIRLVVVPFDSLVGVRPLVEALRNAVNAGDMDGMDEVTEKLMALTSAAQSVDLSEEEWRRFLSGIRASNPTFQSAYLLSSEVYAPFFPNVTSGTIVLQLPIEEEEEDV